MVNDQEPPAANARGLYGSRAARGHFGFLDRMGYQRQSSRDYNIAELLDATWIAIAMCIVLGTAALLMIH
ncbi:MAG: hypothetical protein OEM59_00675 [Rhodospirillales bacterium]|nr:hypothetical protein [Rhodospirillales bacterium]